MYRPTLLFSYFAVHLLHFPSYTYSYVVNEGTECRVIPESQTHDGLPVDDTPSILQAFELCGTNGSILLHEEKYHINQVMNTTNLQNCHFDLTGEMLWSTNIPYWLDHSMSVEYQNLSTAWLFGGVNVTFFGHGTGVLNGNGQSWYDQNRNNSNQPGRPMSITIFNSTNLYMDGVSFKQSQFWSSFVSRSENVTMANIDVNSTTSTSNSAINTDGSDTWNSRNVQWLNWTVENGDDCLAVKGNSTNIYAKNITCVNGYGTPIGSVGQVPGHPDYVSDILFEDVRLLGCYDGAYIKAWQGAPTDVTGNGDSGGGGGGSAKNVTFRNYYMENVTLPIYVTECIYGGDPSVCDTSTFQISDFTWENVTGTSKYNIFSSIHCGNLVPCPGLKFLDINLQTWNQSIGIPSVEPVYQCANIVGQNATGANATNIPCNQFAPNNVPQVPKGNSVLTS